ncbi:hypothetical protein B0H10DRAFT_2119146 [Mycena sp. CBHHK59/15]|nr:hypothetical protein B0H10DRAFT_2119146 [Mycena sp. CBHHK59/15]
MTRRREFLYILLRYLILPPRSLAISNSMEGLLAAEAGLGIAVTTTNIIKRRLPSHKLKKGFALLYNAMLLLYQEMDILPKDLAERMLDAYDLQARLFAGFLAMKLDFPRCLAHPKVMCQVMAFYTISSSNARHERARKALNEGHPVNIGLPELSQQMAELTRSWGAHLDYFQGLKEVGRVIESKLSEKNPESLSNSSSSTIQVVVNDCADSGYIWGWTEVPSSPIVIADRESSQVGHEEEEYIPGLAGLGGS